MGVIIAIVFFLFFGLMVLGFFVSVIKAGYNGFRNNFALCIVFVIYIWLLIAYTKTTLWITGVSVVLFMVVAYISAENDAKKIRELMSHLLESNDIMKIKNFYSECSEEGKRNVLDTIAESNSLEKFGIKNILFSMDFIEIINKNLNHENQESIMECADLEAELKKVWGGRIDNSYFRFEESPLDDMEMQKIEIMSNGKEEKNKGKMIHLIKFRKRQHRDPFEGAIEL